MTIVDVIPKVSLIVDVAKLKALKDALETARDTVEAAWVPNSSTIIDKLDILITEIDRVTTPPHTVAVSDSRLFHAIAIDVKNTSCQCSIGRDHFYVEMDPEEYNFIFFPQDLFSKPADSIETSHLTYNQDPGTRWKYICVCPRNEDHDMSVFSEVEFAEHVREERVA
jgi:hypothetical protein